MHAAAAAAKLLQSCPTLRDPIDGSPPRLPRPWDSPGKNTGVGCHFLLQCMQVKSESGVAQSCPTLSDPMDCSLPGSSIHGIFQARVLEWGAITFSKKQESSRKISSSALLSTPKPLTVWITTNCGKFLKRWEYQTTLTSSWVICMQVRSASRLFIVTLLIWLLCTVHH